MTLLQARRVQEATCPPVPAVSVIIVNWNGLADTLACLESLAEVVYPDLTVVVVDNGSRSEEAGAIRAAYPVGGRLQVVVLEAGRNLGFSGGNNLGIRHVLAGGAHYVLCLNNDTVVAPDFLEPLVRALEDSPRAGLAVSKIFHYDRPDEVWFVNGVCAFDEHSIWIGGPARHEHDAGLTAATEPFETGYACGCALLVRAGILREMGGFDERYFAYAEDVDLSLRAKKAGWRLLTVPASRVWHKVSRASGGGDSPSVLYYGLRNTWLLARSYAPGGRAGAVDYYRACVRQQMERFHKEVRHPDPAGHKRARARLSAIWCARLGLFGRRQDHPIVEQVVALLVETPWWVRRQTFPKRVFWYLNAHLFARFGRLYRRALRGSASAQHR